MNDTFLHAKRRVVRALTAAAFAVLCAVGCAGERIALPEEPDDSGIVIGEIAYVVQYRWSDIPSFTDMVLASGILFAIEDETSVRAYLSDTADPTVNATFGFPDTVMVEDDLLEQPIELAVGRGNTLWVAFAQPELRLVEFTIGSPLEQTGEWVSGRRIGQLGGVAVDSDSGYVYVSDSEKNTVSKYRASSEGGAHVTDLSTEGRGDSFVSEPGGLFYFSDSLLVADSMNNRIQVIHADEPITGRGEVLSPAGEPLGLRSPVDVWMDRAGLFYVAERGRVTQITTEGEIKEIVTERDAESAAFPPAVVANTEQVWVPDPEMQRLTVYQINTVAENLP